MDVYVPAVPKRHVITEQLATDVLWNPPLGVWLFWRVKLDAFQSVALKMAWFVPESENSSGAGVGKTVIDFFWLNLAAVLMHDLRCAAIYQTFQAGMDNYWSNYTTFKGTPLFQAQVGGFDEEGKIKKGTSREDGCRKMRYLNGSIVEMPAPGFLREAENLAGRNYNRLLIDEWGKVVGSSGGFVGVTKQLFTRVRRRAFNKDHPIWQNKTLLTSTAVSGPHPQKKIHKTYADGDRTGNPKRGYLTFNYKHFSNLKCHTGKTFRDEFRDESMVERVRSANTEDGELAELGGFYAKQTRGWYTEDMVKNARGLGVQRRLRPVTSRADDVAATEKTYYFLGGDPAPSQGQKSDRGALMILRAIQTAEEATGNESDYDLDFVWAKILRGKDVDDWSGQIHEKHRDFGFTIALNDWGGGGQWVFPKLGKSKQLISGVETVVTPIVPRDSAEIEGHPILVHFLRRELVKLWPDLKNATGDDVLRDIAETALRTALDKTLIGLPPEFNSIPAEEKVGWSTEKIWAAKLLGSFARELQDVVVEVDENGDWKLSKNNARQFGSNSKDDLANAGRNAYVGFKLWLSSEDMEMHVPEEDATFCRTR